MAQKLLFLTGHLAEDRLTAAIAGAGLPQGCWRVANIGIKVAALMTELIVRNRLKGPLDADRVIVPGRTHMNLESLSAHYGVSFERGPDELFDVPSFLGRGGRPPDFSRHDLTIFAEIVEAADLAIPDLLARARADRTHGADVVDIGCSPDTTFSGLEAVIAALKADGFKVSVDSGNEDELRRAIAAGADHVLSLDETNVEMAQGSACVPVLVPKPHGDLASLIRALDKAAALGIRAIADPILDPIHFGFTASLQRYAQLRRQRPDAEMLMGTGNLTELTDADTGGITALLLGICSELGIRNVLTVQVSPHTRRTIAEHDAARRLMHRAKEDGALPKGYGGAGLIGLHDLKPFPQTSGEIAAAAREVRDGNFRIEVSAEGIHVYNRDGHQLVTDPFAAYAGLKVDDDASHAFYLGYELAKAEIAWRLAKRFSQDNPLDWGVAADKPEAPSTEVPPEARHPVAKSKQRKHTEE